MDLLKDIGPLPETTCVHLDADYDSGVTRTLLAERGLQGAIAHKGLPAPVQATKRWPVERTHAWHNTFYKLARCTERRQIVADFYIALANTIVLVRRLLRRAWILYRGDTRPDAGRDLVRKFAQSGRRQHPGGAKRSRDGL